MDKTEDKNNVGPEDVTIVASPVPATTRILEPTTPRPLLSTSDQRLLELGYQPEFKRDMSLFGVLGMSFCAIGILTGMSSAIQTGLLSGGPLGLFWGWNICSIFMLVIALCLAEICSAYPTMGGLYFWVCKMKPDLPILGFCTGWLYTIAMIFTGTSGNLSTALYVASIIEISTGRSLTRLQIAAMAWLVTVLSGILNTMGTKTIGRMSAFNVWWTLGGTVVLVVVLLVRAPKFNSAKFVFTDFENFTGYTSRPFIVLLGFLQAVYTLEGCETAAQVAEEALNAERLAPYAIVGSIVGSWAVGVCYLAVLLVVVQNVERVRVTGLALPIAQLVLDAVSGRGVSVNVGNDNENGGGAVGREVRVFAAVLLGIIGLAQGMAAATAYAASARLVYALARDGQQRQRQVHDPICNAGTNPGPIPSSGLDATQSHSSTGDDHEQRTVRSRTALGRVIAWMRKWCLKKNKGQAPYVGVWLSVAVGCLIECAYIGSTVAFNAILSAAAVSVMLSYAAPLLIRVRYPQSSLPLSARGPFHLGRWSQAANIVGLLFAAATSILFLLPTSVPVQATTMNYAPAAVGALVIILGVFGVLFARGSARVRGGAYREGEGVIGEKDSK